MILENLLLLNNEDIMISRFAHDPLRRFLPTHKLPRVMPDALLSYLASYCKYLGITTCRLSKNRELLVLMSLLVQQELHTLVFLQHVYNGDRPGESAVGLNMSDLTESIGLYRGCGCGAGSSHGVYSAPTISRSDSGPELS